MVTALYAGLLGLIYIALSFFVVRGRFQYKVSLGDGGQMDLNKRIRLHANFGEYVPLALILLYLIEQEGISETTIHALGIILVIARVMHPFGIYMKEGTSLLRVIGMVLTFVVIIAASLLCISSFFVF